MMECQECVRFVCDVTIQVVVASGLSSRSAYSCTAVAITHAGRGERSEKTKAETSAVPPAVADVTVTWQMTYMGYPETNYLISFFFWGGMT